MRARDGAASGIQDGVHLRWADPAGVDGMTGELSHILDDGERDRLDATVDPSARSRFVLGRVLIRQLIGELTGAHPSDVRISAGCPDCGTAHGRPLVEFTGSADPTEPRPHISIAHCRDAVVVAASWAAPVGVDVEPTVGGARRAESIRTIAGRPFRALGRRESDPIVHWTRVEAVLKADGRGLRVDPHRVRIHELGGWVEGRIGDESARYRLTEPKLDPSLRVSVALRLDEPGAARTGPIPLAWRREDAEPGSRR